MPSGGSYGVVARTTAAALLATGFLWAEGIPEPGLVMYGVVLNVSPAGITNRLTSGTLACQITAANGLPVALTTNLQNLNDQFSYVLLVPFETRVAGLDLTAGALELTASGGTFQRHFSVNGALATPRLPARPQFAFAPPDRARQERVDLVVGIEFLDVNANGLPDWWEEQYFHGGADPAADTDHDGLSNRAEFLAGTDPIDPRSVFEFISINCAAGPGLFVEWASRPGKHYSVLRSPSVVGTYALVSSNLVATPPVNVFRDSNAPAANASFYRLLVQ
jgi:hypothetical protein